MSRGPAPARSAPPPAPLFDVVIDAERETDLSPGAAEGLLRCEHFDAVAGRIVLLGPLGPFESSTEKNNGFLEGDFGAGGLGRAITGAVEARRHLLVVSAATIPNVDCVGRLVEAFERDPMIGFAVPRFGTSDGADVFPLPADRAAHGSATYSRKLLPLLPEVYLCPEVLPGVVLMRREMLTGLGKIDGDLPSATAALLVTIIQGRRLGYRVAMVNRAVTPAASREAAYPPVDGADLAAISERYPCHALAQSLYAALSAHRREALLASAIDGGSGRRRHLLLDVRGLTPYHNGTTVAILGALDGLADLDGDWSIDLLANREAAQWHHLSARYPKFPVVLDRPNEVYAVAVRLCQPWSLRTLVELHSHALKVVVTMLDTIMWDILYPCPAPVTGLAGAWEFAATYLDGLLFISEYSRRRFNFRFPTAPHVRQVVSGLSFTGGGAVAAGPPREARRIDILIFGNDYDHKWVNGALDWIAVGFPFASIVAFGLSESPHPNVRTLPSGKLTDRRIARLFATAKILCFPSLYEGFGLPIIEGLSYGLDVVARRSDLLEEIAAQCHGPGRILPFDDPVSMIECIGRSLAGTEVETLPLGTGIPSGSQPGGWKDVAARIMGLVEEIAADPSPHVYDSREAAVRILRSAVPDLA